MLKKENNYWYVLRTRSRFEKKCESLLQRDEYEVFLPLQKRMRVWSDRKKIIETPLFPGYIFIKIDVNQRYKILQYVGISKFVRFDGKDAIIAENEINAIKKLIQKEEPIEVVDIELYIGEDIKIVSGPFKGFFGKLIKLKNKEKILVEIISMGKVLLLEIGRTRIEKITNTAVNIKAV